MFTAQGSQMPQEANFGAKVVKILRMCKKIAKKNRYFQDNGHYANR